MGKGTLFFCCSCIILALTIVNLSIGPCISGKLFDNDESWGTLNCAAIKDEYDEQSGLSKEQEKAYEVQIDRCDRRKAMYNMEYTSFIFDIVIGFICGLLGLLHIFDVKKEFVSKTGLIGLICGVIGFVFTLVYIIFNGLVFTSNYSGVIKTDENGVFAQYDSANSEYKCLNYDDSGDTFSVYAKYSELNKKQYNYDKDLYKSYSSSPKSDCIRSSEVENCETSATISHTSPDYDYYDSDGNTRPCPYLYADEQDEFTNQDIYDRFLTALILSLVVCLANIGLALFGFLLFRTPGEF